MPALGPPCASWANVAGTEEMGGHLFFGGMVNALTMNHQTWYYDCAADAWTLRSNLSLSGAGALTASISNGDVVAVGGISPVGPVDGVYFYDSDFDSNDGKW